MLDIVAARRQDGVVFLAWGKPASERVKKIDTKKHLKLESVHPSPLSAARGFFECRHFVKANDWLTERYGIDSTIDWNCLARQPDQETAKQAKSAAPPAPTERDEIGQVDARETTAEPVPDKKAPAMAPEESFGVSQEEEELMAAAQEEVEAVFPTPNTDVESKS